MSFGERLAILRKAKKKTQQDISRILGIARTTYASYEQGHRQPDLDTLNSLADYFGVTVDYLLTGRYVSELPDDVQHYYNKSIRGQWSLVVPSGTEITLNAQSIIKTTKEMTLEQIIEKYFYHIPQFEDKNNLEVFDISGDIWFVVRNLDKEKVPPRKPSPEFLSDRIFELLEYREITKESLCDKVGISIKEFEGIIENNSVFPPLEIIEKIASTLETSIEFLTGKLDFLEQEKIQMAGQEVKLSPDEKKIFEELKKHPILFHDLASDPEKKIKELIKLYKMKKMFLEEDEEEHGDGFGEFED